MPSGSAAPLPRIGHAQCAANGQLIVFGGRTSVSMGEGDLNDLWSFDPEAVAWTPLEAASGEPQEGEEDEEGAVAGGPSDDTSWMVQEPGYWAR